MWKELWQDLRVAVRSLVKAPRFTVIAAFTLALGIGANTAIFSVVDGVLLEPLEYPDSDELVMVLSNAPGLGYDRFPLSPDVYFFYRSESSSFQDIGTFKHDAAASVIAGHVAEVFQKF